MPSGIVGFLFEKYPLIQDYRRISKVKTTTESGSQVQDTFGQRILYDIIGTVSKEVTQCHSHREAICQPDIQ